MKQRRTLLRGCLALALATAVWLPCVHLLFAWFQRFFRAPMCSLQGFLFRAAIIAVVFAICHLLGWREHTTFLTGTPTAAETGLSTSATLGTFYMAAYFAFVLLTPILLVAASILFVWQRLPGPPSQK